MKKKFEKITGDYWGLYQCEAEECAQKADWETSNRVKSYSLRPHYLCEECHEMWKEVNREEE